jgi:hypothetical protein
LERLIGPRPYEIKEHEVNIIAPEAEVPTVIQEPIDSPSEQSETAETETPNQD